MELREDTMINNSKLWRSIARSLLGVKCDVGIYTHWNKLKDIDELEKEGKLRVYRPEEEDEQHG